MKSRKSLNKKQARVLGELDKLARRAGLVVSAGNLVFAGLKLRPGSCVLRQENWLVIDRFQPYEDQLDTYRHGLANAPRGKDYLDSLSPEAKEALGQLQAPRPQGEAQEPARGLGQS